MQNALFSLVESTETLAVKRTLIDYLTFRLSCSLYSNHTYEFLGEGKGRVGTCVNSE